MNTCIMYLQQIVVSSKSYVIDLYFYSFQLIQLSSLNYCLQTEVYSLLSKMPWFESYSKKTPKCISEIIILETYFYRKKYYCFRTLTVFQ